MHKAILTAAVLTLVPAQAWAGCGNLKSPASDQPADVKFVNHTKGAVNVSWFKFNGGTKHYSTLAAGQSYIQATYRNHVWALTDAKGKCITTYAVRQSGTFDIE